MSALGHTYRWQAYNGTGGTVAVTVTARLWKFASDGSITWSAEQTPISASSLTTGVYGNSATIGNSTDEYLGAELTVFMDVSASVTGAVTLFIQRSTDAGTDWPTDGGGEVVGSYFFNASDVDTTVNYTV